MKLGVIAENDSTCKEATFYTEKKIFVSGKVKETGFIPLEKMNGGSVEKRSSEAEIFAMRIRKWLFSSSDNLFLILAELI